MGSPTVRRRATTGPGAVIGALAMLTVLLRVPCSADESRIVGGFPVDGSSTKHQVSIRVRTVDQGTFGRGHICGGSLINRSTVLTAAHCLVDVSDRPRPAAYFRVVGGANNRSTQTPNTVIRDVRQVVVHAGYVAQGFRNDIGLLMLATDVPAGHPTLQPIVTTVQVPPNATPCQTSGWGSVYYDGPSSEALLAVNVSIIATATCNALTSYGGSVVAGMLCAGDMAGNKDACQGDSGGPLVCNGVLVGVVSHGVECARPRYPGVYADVAYYRDWIARNHTTGAPGSNGRGAALLPAAGSLGLVTLVLAHLFALRHQLAAQ